MAIFTARWVIYSKLKKRKFKVTDWFLVSLMLFKSKLANFTSSFCVNAQFIVNLF